MTTIYGSGYVADMGNVITLPKLPLGPYEEWIEIDYEGLRARDLAVAKAVLEAAAKVCEEQMESAYAMYHGDVKPIPESGLTSGYAYFEGQGDGAASCGDGIRALKIEGEAT